MKWGGGERRSWAKPATQPHSPLSQLPTSTALVPDSDRSRPHSQQPPTACVTAPDTPLWAHSPSDASLGLGCVRTGGGLKWAGV